MNNDAINRLETVEMQIDAVVAAQKEMQANLIAMHNSMIEISREVGRLYAGLQQMSHRITQGSEGGNEYV